MAAGARFRGIFAGSDVGGERVSAASEQAEQYQA
jgi:hypothetical protein